MEPSRIYSLLQDRIGLDIDSIGPAMVSRAIKSRMDATGIRDEQAYFGALKVSPVEMNELIEQVVVHETWFFRGKESFQFLRRLALSEYSVQRNSLLHILSVACASGEEPYSIAMTLMEAGITSDHFQIDAIDISETSMEKAKRGIYSIHSFRGTDPEFRERYFEKTGDGWLLTPRIRKAVHFLQHNLIETPPSLKSVRYDVIFCRNLLIYLNAAARSKILQLLHRILAPEGILFVGHAEAGFPVAPYFDTVRPLNAFAHRKR